MLHGEDQLGDGLIADIVAIVRHACAPPSRRGEPMKTLAIVLFGLPLIALPASEVSAAGPSKIHHRHAKRYVRQALPTTDRRPEYPDASGWYPHDASKLPFGSALCWDQMMREGRLKRN
jgi:hypothetical protein